MEEDFYASLRGISTKVSKCSLSTVKLEETSKVLIDHYTGPTPSERSVLGVFTMERYCSSLDKSVEMDIKTGDCPRLCEESLQYSLTTSLQPMVLGSGGNFFNFRIRSSTHIGVFDAPYNMIWKGVFNLLTVLKMTC